MKRTCNNCRALNGERCGLGFKNESRGLFAKDQTGFFLGMKPSEECPKPLTYVEWLYEVDTKTAQQ